QVRQALLPARGAQSTRQIDPVPRLFELIVRKPAMQLAFEDCARRLGADLGESTHVEEELHAGPQTRLDLRVLAALEHDAKTAFGNLDDFLVDLARLKDLEMLLGHRGQHALAHLASLQESAEKEG